jgi:hypothetical protein
MHPEIAYKRQKLVIVYLRHGFGSNGCSISSEEKAYNKLSKSFGLALHSRAAYFLNSYE